MHLIGTHSMTNENEPRSEYLDLGARVAAAARSLQEDAAFAEVSAWAFLWAAGLFALGEAADSALAPHRRMRELSTTVEGTISDPNLLRIINDARAADLNEQYHELALLALSQPVYDAAARGWLRRAHVTASGDRWWAEFMSHVEAKGPPEVRTVAREVDVTLRLGRDRLVAPSSGPPCRSPSPIGRQSRAHESHRSFGNRTTGQGFRPSPRSKCGAPARDPEP
jgi:hypothetical protein